MDIVEFAEKSVGYELPEWQKNYLQVLYEKGKDEKIYIRMLKNHGRSQFYTYFENAKELVLNGAPNDCK